MRYFLFILFFGLIACKSHKSPMISLPKDMYKLVKNAPEEIEALKKAAIKSDVSFEMNFDNGSFAGKYEQITFKGKYTIIKVTSGLAKGFNYEVELESLQNDPTSSKAEEKFIKHLASCTSIFVAPNRLYQPTHIVLDIRSEGQKSSFYLIN